MIRTFSTFVLSTMMLMSSMTTFGNTKTNSDRIVRTTVTYVNNNHRGSVTSPDRSHFDNCRTSCCTKQHSSCCTHSSHSKKYCCQGKSHKHKFNKYGVCVKCDRTKKQIRRYERKGCHR